MTDMIYSYSWKTLKDFLEKAEAFSEKSFSFFIYALYFFTSDRYSWWIATNSSDVGIVD